MTTSIRQYDLLDGVLPPDTPLGNYCCQPPALPPPPANPLDHYKRFGVTADEHVAALEWLSDNNQEFADLEDRLAAIELGETTGDAVAVQEQLDQIVAAYLRRPAPQRAMPVQPPRLKWNQLAQGRKTLVPELEKHLRDKGWPYVAVTEARKAIFGGSGIGTFDYLVYSSTGPNLLVLVITRRPTADQVEQMQEWEKVFGKDFEAAFVFQAAGQWRLITLKDLETHDPLGQSAVLVDRLEKNHDK